MTSVVEPLPVDGEGGGSSAPSQLHRRCHSAPLDRLASCATHQRPRFVSSELLGLDNFVKGFNSMLKRSLGCLTGCHPSYRRESDEADMQPAVDGETEDEATTSTPAARRLTPSRSASSLVLLSASPLVLQDCSVLAPHGRVAPAMTVSSLETEHEKESITQAVTQARSTVHTAFRPLNVSTLGEVLTLNPPDILHISAHGAQLQNGDYALVLENDSGCARFFNMDNLRKMLSVRTTSRPLLVFLSACHSELAGRLFVEAGCDHVIVCRKDERVLDSSARYFLKFFYPSLMQGRTLQEAFDTACANVDAAFTDQPNEAKKFLLLPERAGAHDVTLFPSVDTSLPSSCSDRRQPLASPVGFSPVVEEEDTSALPPVTDQFVGRAVEVHQTIALLRKHRAVTVFGTRRFGKSSVAKSACHYLLNRKRFADGIVWVDMSTVRDRQDFAAHLVGSGAADVPASHTTSTSPSSTQDYLAVCLRSMARKRVLVVLDNAGGALGNYLSLEVLRHTHSVRVLHTASRPLQLDVSLGFSVGLVCVRSLSQQACLKLVYLLAPWMVEPNEYQRTLAMVNQLGGNPYAIRCEVQNRQQELSLSQFIVDLSMDAPHTHGPPPCQLHPDDTSDELQEVVLVDMP